MGSQVEDFLKELAENAEFRKKFEEASDEGKDKLASSYSGDMSTEEFKKEVLSVKDKSGSNLGSMKDDELATVSGGRNIRETVDVWARPRIPRDPRHGHLGHDHKERRDKRGPFRNWIGNFCGHTKF